MSLDHFYVRDPSLSDEENALNAARHLRRVVNGTEPTDETRLAAALAALDRIGLTGSPIVC